METKFEIGDVVSRDRGVQKGTIESFDKLGRPILDNDTEKSVGWHPTRLTLVRRASAQREGGFAVGQRVRVKSAASRPTKSCFPSIVGEVGVILELSSDPEEPGHNVRITEPVDRDNLGCWYVHPSDLEPADPAPAQPHRHVSDSDGHCGVCGIAPGEDVPPQPAPMTRAARVLAKMERDPYIQNLETLEQRIGIDQMVSPKRIDQYTADATDNEPKQQKARERMAAMTVDLDRELTYDPKRWSQLYGPVNPVTSRAVRGRR